MEEKIDISEFLGKRTLVIGDVNTGKTTFSRKILEEMSRLQINKRIAIIDLAPEIPEEWALGNKFKGIGGKLLPIAGKGIFYSRPPIKPPRLSSKNEKEAISIAEKNRKGIEILFERFVPADGDILFLNDISLYLQAGSAKKLLKWMDNAHTIVANGYYGEKLGKGVLSQRERREMGFLVELFDRIIRL